MKMVHGIFLGGLRFVSLHKKVLYQRVEGSLPFQSAISVNSAKISFFRNATEIISVTTIGILSEENKTIVKLRL